MVRLMQLFCAPFPFPSNINESKSLQTFRDIKNIPDKNKTISILNNYKTAHHGTSNCAIFK